MANRERSYSERVARQQAEQMVDLFLEVIFSSDRDAGWQGHNLIGKLVDFRGELPNSSGHNGFSKVWEKSRLLSQWSDAHKMACLMMGRLSDRKQEAVAVDRSYRNHVKVAIDPFVPDKRIELLWDDRRCADYLGCTINAFRKRIHEGYQDLEAELRAMIESAA